MAGGDPDAARAGPAGARRAGLAGRPRRRPGRRRGHQARGQRPGPRPERRPLRGAGPGRAGRRRPRRPPTRCSRAAPAARRSSSTSARRTSIPRAPPVAFSLDLVAKDLELITGLGERVGRADARRPRPRSTSSAERDRGRVTASGTSARSPSFLRGGGADGPYRQGADRPRPPHARRSSKGRSTGYTGDAVVDEAGGSVQMGFRVARLDAGGTVDSPRALVRGVGLRRSTAASRSTPPRAATSWSAGDYGADPGRHDPRVPRTPPTPPSSSPR